MATSQSSMSALSLFSGAGGMDLGVHRAGFNVLAGIEKDDNCIATLEASAGHIERIIHADIRHIRPDDLLEDLHLAPGELTLLFGGPPCQSFSQIGKRKGLEDERGLLLFQMIRFAQVFQPQAILIEQVRGLLNARGKNEKKGEVFKLFLQSLEDIGYQVKWKLLNAADYGVPQLRKRVFIIAMPHDNSFTFPQPTHTPADKVTPLLSLKPYVTVGDVINDLGKPALKGSEREDSHIDITPERDIERIHHVPEGSYLAAQTHLSKDLRGRLTRKDTTKFRRMSFDEPCLTLRGGEAFYHPVEDRYFTPRECMRLHTFPDDYFLKGPIRGRSGSVRDLDQHRQVANSVPPQLAYILAEQLMKALNTCQKSMNFSATR